MTFSVTYGADYAEMCGIVNDIDMLKKGMENVPNARYYVAVSHQLHLPAHAGSSLGCPLGICRRQCRQQRPCSAVPQTPMAAKRRENDLNRPWVLDHGSIPCYPVGLTG